MRTIWWNMTGEAAGTFTVLWCAVSWLPERVAPSVKWTKLTFWIDDGWQQWWQQEGCVTWLLFPYTHTHTCQTVLPSCSVLSSPRWRGKWCQTGWAFLGQPVHPMRAQKEQETARNPQNLYCSLCPHDLYCIREGETEGVTGGGPTRRVSGSGPTLSHLLGRMFSCLCWKDGDGVTASRADWFTLAASSCRWKTQWEGVRLIHASDRVFLHLPIHYFYTLAKL